MNWNEVLKSIFFTLGSASLFLIPYKISKWFILKDNIAVPILHKTTSNWDYLKATSVSIILSIMLFFGGSSNDQDEYQTINESSLNVEEVFAFILTITVGGIVGVFASHRIISDRNEKEYYAKQMLIEEQNNIYQKDMKETNIKLIQYCEKVINDYGEVLGASPTGIIARKQSTFIDTKEIIQNSFEMYIKAMKENLSKKDIFILRTSYMAIGQFVPDHMAEAINRAHINKDTASLNDIALYDGFLKEVYINPSTFIETFDSFLLK